MIRRRGPHLGRRNRDRFGPESAPILMVASLGRYRLRMMQVLQSQLPELEIYVGDRAPDGTVRVLGHDDLRCHELRNTYLPGGFLVQSGVRWRRLATAGAVVLDLNPRVPLNWVVLLVRRCLRKSTILWGHAWPRSGPASRTARIRHWMRSLATGLIAYTETEARDLRSVHPSLSVFTAPNSLYLKEAIRFDTESERVTFIYVGRLVSEKKPHLAIEAFARLDRRHRESSRLVVVGEGPERGRLADLVTRLELGSQVSLLPYEDDVERLRILYSAARASLSPGYVGLSAVQSICFGVPVIVADIEPHAPEIEALRPEFNAVMFAHDDASDLARAMADVMTRRDGLLAPGFEVATDASDRYSAEAMAAGFVAAITSASAGSDP